MRGRRDQPVGLAQLLSHSSLENSFKDHKHIYKNMQMEMKSTKVRTLSALLHYIPVRVYEYACAEIGHASRCSSCICACTYYIVQETRSRQPVVVQHGLSCISRYRLWRG